MSDERDNEIILMLKAGMQPGPVADEMNVSEATVRRVAKKAGIKAQPRDAGLPIADVIEDYQAELPIKNILGRFEISYSKLYTILAENDVPVRRSANAAARERQLDEAVAMYEDGEPIHLIVSETGVSQPTLHSELHKRGVALRRPRK